MKTIAIRWVKREYYMPALISVPRTLTLDVLMASMVERKLTLDRERLLMAEAIEATAKFRAVFDQSSIFAGILSLDGTVIDANRICLDACGYRKEDIVGKLFWETGWWRFNKEVQDKIREATLRAARGEAYREELPYHLADGTERMVDFALHPVRDDQERIIFLHPTGTDITSRKQVEEELKTTRAELEKRVAERTAELNIANENLRDLSARLLNTRDHEARRLARELHDSVGQLLAAISMNTGKVTAQAHKLDEAGANAVAENAALVQQISSEIRTISHLLHPPLLDELGLGSALRWYIETFSERSEIKIDIKLPDDLGRLSTEIETAIFRIVQECLTNIHRHSGSKTATIGMVKKDCQIVLAIQDAGRGIPPSKLRSAGDGWSGVGFRGMLERIRYLGGTLNIDSGAQGTTVTAKLPFEPVDPEP
jgi:PAS domain S-box-containing protein